MNIFLNGVEIAIVKSELHFNQGVAIGTAADEDGNIYKLEWKIKPEYIEARNDIQYWENLKMAKVICGLSIEEQKQFDAIVEKYPSLKNSESPDILKNKYNACDWNNPLVLQDAI